MAHGKGNHLEVLSWFSMCADSAQKRFNKLLQKSYEDIFLKNDSLLTRTQQIDDLLQKDTLLQKECFNLSTVASK